MSIPGIHTDITWDSVGGLHNVHELLNIEILVSFLVFIKDKIITLTFIFLSGVLIKYYRIVFTHSVIHQYCLLALPVAVKL
jgi:hypothetical protein